LLDVIGLATAVANYTTTVLTAFNNQLTPQDVIQIGNETDNGFSRPVEQIFSSTGTNWDDYATVTKAAITASRITSPEAAVMIHYDGVATSGSFYYELLLHGVD